PVAQPDLDAVAEPATGPHAEEAGDRHVGEVAEHDDHPYAAEQRQLAREVRHAVVALLRRGLVRGRCAADDGRDVGTREPEAVVAALARGLVGEAGAMERAEDPVARAIARGDAPGAVPAVGGGREPDEEHPRVGLAEPGNGTRPVVLVAVRGPLLATDRLAPLDQPRAPAALDDLRGHAGERIHVWRVG